MGASPSQIHQRWKPIGDVHELPVLHAFLFQQGACHEACSSDAAFPQGPFPSSKWPVVASRPSLPAVVCGEDEDRVVPEPSAFQGFGDIPHGFVQEGHHPCINTSVLVLHELIWLHVLLGDLQGIVDRLESKVEEQWFLGGVVSYEGCSPFGKYVC